MFDALRDLFMAGGWVMWPLAILSVISVALSLERAIFWWGMRRAGRGERGGWIRRVAEMLASGRAKEARAVAAEDRTPYGRFVLLLVPEGESSEGNPGAGASAAPEAAVEEVRADIERFSTTLSTIITAAPMLGILGTVLGIIRSFRLLGATEELVVDPTQVAGGIAEALITTAFGLAIALITLFPYAIFRAAADRCFGRLETLAAAVENSKSADQQSSK